MSVKAIVRIALGGVIIVGVIVCAIGVFLGGSPSVSLTSRGLRFASPYNPNDVEVKVQEFAAQDIKNLDIDAEYASELNITFGDTFKVEYPSPNFEAVQDADTLRISSNEELNISFIGIGLFGYRYDHSDEFIVNITVPHGHIFRDVSIVSDLSAVEVTDMTADSMTIVANLGAIDISGITADVLDVTADVGSLNLNNITAGEAVANSNLGSVIIKDSDFDTLTSVVNTGEFELDGSSPDYLDVECNLGNVDISLFGAQEDYTVDAITNLGTFSLNGEVRGTPNVWGSGDKEVFIVTNTGSAYVDFVG